MSLFTVCKKVTLNMFSSDLRLFHLPLVDVYYKTVYYLESQFIYLLISTMLM
jgi:hypothetical protein